MAAAEGDGAFKKVSILLPLPNGERGFGSKFQCQKAKRGKYPNRMGYGCQRQVWIRDLEQGMTGYNFPGHQANGAVNCVSFHPKAGWGLSGDATGCVKVWTCREVEPIVKNTVQCGKGVSDVAWGPEGRKILMVGNGKEEAGKVTPWDTNNQNGIFTASKQLLGCAYRPKRPYTIAYVGEHGHVCFHKGPPFERKIVDCTVHHKFTNDVRYSPNGKWCVVCSSDKRMSIFDGKTGELIKEFGKKGGHSGSIYGICWNGNSDRIATASADKTIKIWSVPATLEEIQAKGSIPCIATVEIGRKEIIDMQANVEWLEDMIYSCSQNGDINVISAADDNYAVQAVWSGHKKAIKDLVRIPGTNETLSTCPDAKVVRTNWDNGETKLYRGDGHGRRKYAHLLYACPDGQTLYSAGNDDCVLQSDLSEADLGETKYQCNGVIRFLCGCPELGDIVLVGTSRGNLYALQGDNCLSEVDTGLGMGKADCVNTPDGVELFVPHENKVIVYSVSAEGDIAQNRVLEDVNFENKKVSMVKCRPEGTHIAVGLGNSEIQIHELDGTKVHSRTLVRHKAKLGAMAWAKRGGDETVALFTVAADNGLRCYTDILNSADNQFELNIMTSACTGVVEMDDGQVLVSSTDGSIKRLECLF